MKGRFLFAAGLYVGVWVVSTVGMLMTQELAQRRMFAGIMTACAFVLLLAVLTHGPRIPIRISNWIEPGIWTVRAVIRSAGRTILLCESGVSQVTWSVHALYDGDIYEHLPEFVGRQRYTVSRDERIPDCVRIVPSA